MGAVLSIHPRDHRKLVMCDSTSKSASSGFHLSSISSKLSKRNATNDQFKSILTSPTAAIATNTTKKHLSLFGWGKHFGMISAKKRHARAAAKQKQIAEQLLLKPSTNSSISNVRSKSNKANNGDNADDADAPVNAANRSSSITPPDPASVRCSRLGLSRGTSGDSGFTIAIGTGSELRAQSSVDSGNADSLAESVQSSLSINQSVCSLTGPKLADSVLPVSTIIMNDSTHHRSTSRQTTTKSNGAVVHIQSNAVSPIDCASNRNDDRAIALNESQTPYDTSGSSDTSAFVSSSSEMSTRCGEQLTLPPQQSSIGCSSKITLSSSVLNAPSSSSSSSDALAGQVHQMNLVNTQISLGPTEAISNVNNITHNLSQHHLHSYPHSSNAVNISSSLASSVSSQTFVSTSVVQNSLLNYSNCSRINRPSAIQLPIQNRFAHLPIAAATSGSTAFASGASSIGSSASSSVGAQSKTIIQVKAEPN